jgi:hypothetical protein
MEIKLFITKAVSIHADFLLYTYLTIFRSQTSVWEPLLPSSAWCGANKMINVKQSLKVGVPKLELIGIYTILITLCKSKSYIFSVK